MLRTCFFVAVCLIAVSVYQVSICQANHLTLRQDDFNTLPDSALATFRTNSRIFWEHEQSQRDGDHHSAFVFSGGIHALSTTLISNSFATVAYVPERINQEGAAITYNALSADVCWTIISANNSGITGWQRTGTTAYYSRCQGNTTPNQPELPAHSAFLMRVTITGSAIADLLDLRLPASYAFYRVYDATDPLYGAKGDGIADDTIAIRAALNAAAANAPSGSHFVLPRGTYRVTADIVIAATGGIFKITGLGTINATETTAGDIIIQGIQGSSAPLTDNIAVGALTLNTALSVVAGDIIRILSTDLWAPQTIGNGLVRGELAEVVSVAGLTVTVKSSIRDSYNAATTTITKLNAPHIIIDRLRILRNANNGIGLYVRYARDVSITNVTIAGARDRGLSIVEVFGGVVSNNHVVDAYVTGGGTQYGFSLDSCQGITVIGNNFLSGRHGAKNGGSFPYRDIKYIGNTIDNNHESGLYAFDGHANGEDIIIDGNHILNGLLLETKNAIVANNIIRTYNYSSGVTFNIGINADSFILKGNTIINDTPVSGNLERNAVVFTSSVLTSQTIGNFEITDNFLKAVGSVIRVTTGTAGGFTFNSLVISNNRIIGNPGIYGFIIQNGGGSSVIHTNASVMHGNIVDAARGVLEDTIGDFIFSGNKVVVTTAPAGIVTSIGTGDANVANNILDGSTLSVGVRFEKTGMAILNGNIIRNMGSAPVTALASISTLIDVDNIYFNNVGSKSIASAIYHSYATGDTNQFAVLRDGGGTTFSCSNARECAVGRPFEAGKMFVVDGGSSTTAQTLEVKNTNGTSFHCSAQRECAVGRPFISGFRLVVDSGLVLTDRILEARNSNGTMFRVDGDGSSITPGSAGGKKVLCIETTAGSPTLGKVYASSNGVDCSN